MPLIIKKSDFVKSATKPSHFPDDIYSEFCFAGKSNVGKSSMLNKICNRKKLAITSKTPGRTQLINFFIINNNMSFVDIPGYGFANVPKNIMLSWEKMIINYLENRKNIDKEIDEEIKNLSSAEEKEMENQFEISEQTDLPENDSSVPNADNSSE